MKNCVKPGDRGEKKYDKKNRQGLQSRDVCRGRPDALEDSGSVLCSLDSDLLQSQVLVLPLHTSPTNIYTYIIVSN